MKKKVLGLAIAALVMVSVMAVAQMPVLKKETKEDCNLCKITIGGTTQFSCRSSPDVDNCLVETENVSVSCGNARVCN